MQTSRGLASGWPLIFLGWTAIGLLQAVLSVVPPREPARVALALFALHLPLAWYWAVASPVVGAWSEWLRTRHSATWRRVLLHLPTLVVLCALHALLRRILLVAIGVDVTVPYWVTLLYYADVSAAAYIVTAWMAFAIEARARITAELRRSHALEAELTEARIDYLETQLRPHFLFNALSAVAELGHGAPGTASRMLGNIIQMLETAFSRGKSVVTLGEEVDGLRPYLELQQLRFSDWLVIDQCIEPEAKCALVPSLILQPLVENAVQHGLRQRDREGRITLRARVEGRWLIIGVSDNGEGLRESTYRERRGIGLGNVRDRLQAMFGKDANLELVAEVPAGTTAHLEIPLVTASVQPEATEPTPGTRGDPRPALFLGTAYEWAERHPRLALGFIWALVGVLRMQHSLAYALFRSGVEAAALARSFLFDLITVVLWVVLTPVAIWCARRLPLRREHLARNAVFHTAMAFGVALAHVAATRALSLGAPDAPLTSGGYVQVYAWNVAVYAIIVAVVHIRAMDHWLAQRHLAVARMELELSQAKLQTVMLDLRPDVIIPTLRRAQEIIERDAEEADRILAELGDFLRRALDSIYMPEDTDDAPPPLSHTFTQPSVR